MWGNNGIFVTMTSSGQSLEQRPLSTEKETERVRHLVQGSRCNTTTHWEANAASLWRQMTQIGWNETCSSHLPCISYSLMNLSGYLLWTRMAIKERWLGEWNTSWPWWETDKLMCEPLLPSVCASARRAFYNLCVCKWGEKQNLLNC